MTRAMNLGHRVLDNNDSGFYAAAAEEYERVLVPRRFEAPARDLLAMVDTATSSPMLDVGTGTGLILDLCSQAGGPCMSWHTEVEYLEPLLLGVEQLLCTVADRVKLRLPDTEERRVPK